MPLSPRMRPARAAASSSSRLRDAQLLVEQRRRSSDRRPAGASRSRSVTGNSASSSWWHGAVAGVGDLANAGGEVLADARQLAQRRRVHPGDRLGGVAHDVGAVAVRADLERVLALDLEEVGDLGRGSRATAVLSQTEAIGLDAEVEQPRAAGRAAPGAHGGRASGGAIAEQAAAAARAADLGGRARRRPARARSGRRSPAW